MVRTLLPDDNAIVMDYNVPIHMANIIQNVYEH